MIVVVVAIVAVSITAVDMSMKWCLCQYPETIDVPCLTNGRHPRNWKCLYEWHISEHGSRRFGSVGGSIRNGSPQEELIRQECRRHLRMLRLLSVDTETVWRQ